MIEKIYRKSSEVAAKTCLSFVGFNILNYIFHTIDQGVDIIDDDINLYSFIVTYSGLIGISAIHFFIWFIKDKKEGGS